MDKEPIELSSLVQHFELFNRTAKSFELEGDGGVSLLPELIDADAGPDAETSAP